MEGKRTKPHEGNLLQAEASPYLQQHAMNPVAWRPWGEAAFAEAKRRDCLVLVSIGYATCHWCHVMEHECFEDQATAAVMNDEFVCVKVDRQEHPDVDAVYMAFLQATTGSGGWPMNVWVTPDGRAVVAGTYFPRESRDGRIGFAEFCRDLGQVWRDDRGRVLASGERVLAYLREKSQASIGRVEEIDFRVARENFTHECADGWDDANAGWGMAPKFPRPCVPRALLHVEGENGYEMAAVALRAVAAGGICDPLGGGFHRYSVDAAWRVPHFEKMLYDQAQIILWALETWQIRGENEFLDLAERTISYVIGELRDPVTGAFHAGEDADSRDEHGISREGAYWVWSAQEIFTALANPRDASLFCRAYGVEAEGNVAESLDPHGDLRGKNILYRALADAELAELFDQSVAEVADSLRQSREILLAVRAKREKPFRDDWQLVSWNAMMVVALARGARVDSRSDWAKIARHVLDWIRDSLWVNGKLRRGFRGVVSDVEAGIADYVWLIAALLENLGVDSTNGNRDCAWILELQRALDQQFWSDQHAGYVTRGMVAGETILELREDYDGAEPAANHIAAENLLKLALLTGDAVWRHKAREILAGSARGGNSHVFAQPAWLVALDSYERELVKIEVGDDVPEEMRVTQKALAFLPRAFWVATPKSRKIQVCSMQACFAPISDAIAWQAQIEKWQTCEPSR